MSEAEGAAPLSDEQRRYLGEHTLAVLGTGRRDGTPQLSMVSYHFDGADIAISVQRSSAKWRNATRLPRATLLVPDGRTQLVVEGRIDLVDGDPDRVALTRRVREGGGSAICRPTPPSSRACSTPRGAQCCASSPIARSRASRSTRCALPSAPLAPSQRSAGLEGLPLLPAPERGGRRGCGEPDGRRAGAARSTLVGVSRACDTRRRLGRCPRADVQVSTC